MIAVVETHPVQYHAPVYRHAVQKMALPMHVVYGGDFSVAGYKDKEFGASFAWDTDLLGGVSHEFLSRMSKGGAGNYDEVRPDGLEAALDALSPQALLSLGYTHPLDRAGLRWASKRRVPLLFRGETSDVARRRHWVKRLLRDTSLRLLYRRCAALLYLGHHSREHYRQRGVSESKLFFSPYCIDASTFQSDAASRDSLRRATRERFGIREDSVVVLFSGKLSERKGVDLLPHAVRKLPASMRDRVHLLFLGDGALRESVQRECEQEPRVPVTFAGFQNQSALSAFYHAADLLALPSRAEETWGLVVNEAMLHGLPCIVSTTVGSQPDLVIPGGTGEVCAPGDAEDLARALTALVARVGDAGLADVCRARVEKYSVAQAAEGLQAAWQAVRPA